jgi:preprotein translocase subunit SecF
MDNILLTFLLTVLCLPYFRLLYNNINKNNFDWQNGLWINIVEKIICGIIIYIIIKKNFEINAIFDFIKNINLDDKIENNTIENKEIENNTIENKEIENKEIENIEESEKSSENVLLNNFNNLFKKKYI